MIPLLLAETTEFRFVDIEGKVLIQRRTLGVFEGEWFWRNVATITQGYDENDPFSEVGDALVELARSYHVLNGQVDDLKVRVNNMEQATVHLQEAMGITAELKIEGDPSNWIDRLEVDTTDNRRMVVPEDPNEVDLLARMDERARQMPREMKSAHAAPFGANCGSPLGSQKGEAK